MEMRKQNESLTEMPPALQFDETVCRVRTKLAGAAEMAAKTSANANARLQT